MIVDFKEIPAANSSDGQQDQFELFAREFLQGMGYTILEQPDRGADGGKDILVQESLRGINKSHDIKWLVSAKHYAHSGGSVKPTDEINIRERVERFNADGFLGFYSTLPSTGLNGTLTGLVAHILTDHFDSAAIERYLTTHKSLGDVFRRFFPASYQSFQKSGGYRDSDLCFPIVDFKLIQDAKTKQFGPVTPLVSLHGEHVLKNVRYSIEESLYTITLQNPVLSRSNGEITLYLDTDTALNTFSIPERENPFLSIHCLVATDRGTFSQNTTAVVTTNPPTFDLQHTSVHRGDRMLFTRHKAHGTNPPQYVDTVHV
ncbi:restriction endonuclease [Neorhodopirellula pilleata]|uniref:Restriction endonuclease type IV Mrr domain-containing protein n=1 Tax=Neorhodopirellula pilleata TaxID=2714738 RepID=A0A5C6A6E4_9BACT|nr:restriction endonuclease [Neorhodopirellula pilleata]TWT94937.1 hypothetical protein Pla100_35150 [Neorhodopirellula pilleata]